MANKFMVMKLRAEILEDIYKDLENRLKDAHQYFGTTGEKEQKTIYNKETKEFDPVFDEAGNPVMVDKWDYIEYTEEELEHNEEASAKIEVIKQLLKDIEKLL